ncbi:MAG: putative transrane protein [Labilithrix sp.]|nr:putative transrane protein [Labilithrix sp.]
MGGSTLEARIFEPRYYLGWLLFTLSAGFVNAGTVVACKSFVTHITGNVTNLAGGSALGGTSLARDYAFIVGMFIGGAMLAVLIAETLRSRPKFAFALPVLASFAILVAIGLAGRAGSFGPFGADQDEMGPRAFTMLGLLGAAMGMVNASIANATANQVRVAHLTGPATDLAGNLVRAALGAGRGTGIELRWATLRFAKLGAFAVGAGLAAKVAGGLRYDVFIAAGGILIVALGFTGAPESNETTETSEATESTETTSQSGAESSGPHAVQSGGEDHRDDRAAE